MVQKIVQVFIAHVREDAPFLQELLGHLKPLEAEGLCHVFTDEQITMGKEWEAEVKNALNESDVILLLISSDFVQSSYFKQFELEKTLYRYRHGQALILPVIVRPANWQDLPVNRYQTLPKEGYPISSYSDRESAWKEGVIQPLRELFTKMSGGRIELNKSVTTEKTSAITGKSPAADQLKADVRKLTSENHVAEAITKLLDYAKATDDPLLSEITLLWSRHKWLDRQKTNGSLGFDEYARAQNQIVLAMLEMLNRVNPKSVESN